MTGELNTKSTYPHCRSDTWGHNGIKAVYGQLWAWRTKYMIVYL